MNHTEEVHYIAFISYRHRPLDAEAAKRIQRSIESYTVPKGLRKEPGQKKLGRVFRDEDELPISSSLSNSITYALDHTDFLIVICTPDLPLSRWCEEEIRYFIRTHDRDHVIGVLADGTPDTSFSPYMLKTFDEAGNFLEPIEPLAANIGGKNHTIDNKMYRKEIYRIYAALLGCRFDELWQREKRARARRMSMVLGAASVLMAAFSVFLISKNATIRQQNEVISEKNEELVAYNATIQEQNEALIAYNATIQEQNEVISEKNDELTANMSSVQTDLGRSLLSERLTAQAIERGIKALEDAGALYDRRAETLLADAVAAYRYEEIVSDVVLENGDSIVDLERAADGALAVMLDCRGDVFCVELSSFRELWRRSISQPEVYTGMTFVELSSFKYYSEIFPAAGGELIVYKDYARVIALSAKSGEEVWRFDYACRESSLYEQQTNIANNAFRVISDDGSLIALLDKPDIDQAGIELIILDAATGAELGRIPLDQEPYDSVYTWYVQGGVFTEDRSVLAVALCAEEGYTYYVTDLARMTVLNTYSYPDSYRGIFYGMIYDPQSGELFCAQLQLRKGGITTSLFRPDGTRETEITYHTISSDIGKYQDGYAYEGFFQPMLTCGDLAVICSDEIALFFDWKANKLVNSCDVSGKILDSVWLEDDASLCLLTASGTPVTYQLGAGNINQASCWTSDVSGLSLGLLASGEGPDGKQALQFVSVPADHENRLLASRTKSDPTMKTVNMRASSYEAYFTSIHYGLSPSKNRLFAFIQASDSRYFVRCLDADTLVVLSSLTIDRVFGADPPIPIDDDRFFYDGMICSMDGSREAFPSGSAAKSEEYGLACLALSDGRILIYDRGTNDYDAKPYIPPCCWIDGELVSYPKNGEALLLEPHSAFYAGRNGLILCLGSSVAETDFENREQSFVAYNVNSGQLSILQDASLASEEQPVIAMGNRKPVFACACTDGSLVLYDAESGAARAVEGELPGGKLLQLCFSGEDQYLLALSDKGALCCIDTETGRVIWSGDVLSDSSDLDRLSRIECSVVENGRLYVCAVWERSAACAIVDPERGVLISTIRDACAVLPEIGKVFFSGSDYVAACELHSADDLLALAKEAIIN
jgi:outer membrane protein assembly factor BamB